MGERRLAGGRYSAPTDEPRSRYRVVWGAERPCAGQRPARADAGHALDAGYLERLGLGKRRQDPGQAPGEHRLAGARRPDHQEVVAAGRRGDQRLHRERVPPDIGEVREPVFCTRWSGGQRLVPRAANGPGQAGEVAERHRLHARYQRGLQRRGRGSDQPPGSLAPCALGGGERTAAGLEPAVERELGEQGYAVEGALRQLVRRGQDGPGNREVERRALLAQPGRGQVDDQSPEREVEARVGDRRPNALPSLGDGSVGHSDHRERGQPGPKVGLDRDPDRVDAVDDESGCPGDHGAKLRAQALPLSPSLSGIARLTPPSLRPRSSASFPAQTGSDFGALVYRAWA